MDRKKRLDSQLQSTPTLYGLDAKAVLDELLEKPTLDQIRRMEDRKNFFISIKRRETK